MSEKGGKGFKQNICVKSLVSSLSQSRRRYWVELWWMKIFKVEVLDLVVHVMFER